MDSVATGAARDVLRRGGNAVDAAVAAAAVLGVTEPFSCGIGGGGFMVIRTPRGKVTTIDSREKAPAAMRPDSFFENGAPLAFADARYSGLSGGVPGTVAGWETALRKYGSWSFARVLRPAIDVARDGFVIDKTFYEQAQDNAGYFDDIRASEALYLDPDGTAHDAGDRAAQPRSRARRTSASPGTAPRASTAGRSPLRWRAPSQRPAADARRRPHVAAGADDGARRAGVHRARAQAHARAATAASTSSAWVRRRRAARPSARR